MTEPSALVIREFAWSDLDDAWALWREAFGRLKPEDDQESLERVVARNPRTFLVAESGGRLVGTAIATTDGRRGFLYHVAVGGTARRRGVGRRLIREAERRLLALGVRTIHLRVEGHNQGAIEFYQALGFTSDPPIMGMRLSRGGEGTPGVTAESPPKGPAD